MIKNQAIENERIEPVINSKSAGIFQSKKEFGEEELAGAYWNGVQYIDFKNVCFINSIIAARLIYLLKTLLKQGAIIKLVNMSEKVKNKIKAMGLERLFLVIHKMA